MSKLEDRLNAPFVPLKPKKLTRKQFLALSDIELLERTITDLESFDRFSTPEQSYKFDLSMFYETINGEKGKSCYVCAAGACAVGALGVNSDKDWRRQKDDHRVGFRLDKISNYALGYPEDGNIELPEMHKEFLMRRGYGRRPDADDNLRRLPARYTLRRQDTIDWLKIVVGYLRQKEKRHQDLLHA